MSNGVEQISDSILYEGYLLYPYRSSALKNQYRWTIGTIFPQTCLLDGERSWIEAQCLLLPQETAALQVQLRFLHLYRRHEAEGALPREFTGQYKFCEVVGSPRRELFSFGNEPDLEQKPIEGAILVGATRIDNRAWRLAVRAENRSTIDAEGKPDRAAAASQALIAAHFILNVEHGSFISLLDPPTEFTEYAARCKSAGVFPVLAGNSGEAHQMLCSPIILYDYPQIAPESVGEFFDNTEIDELIALRVHTLTNQEKQEMHRGDPRVRAILERSETLGAERLKRLHGTQRTDLIANLAQSVRTGQPFEAADFPMVASPLPTLKRGDRVRVTPRRSADAFDLILAGRIAIIDTVEYDIDGGTHVAVVIEDDPGFELGMQGQPGHRFFFSPEELEFVSHSPADSIR
jgi:hypothetical protein